MHENTRRLILLSAGLFCLAACQSKPIEQMSYSETKELAQQLHKRCADQGAPQGSPEFDICMKQEISREASLRQENAATRRRVGAAMANVGQNMQNNAAAMSAQNRPVNCTSRQSYSGGPVYTSCY